MKGFIIIAAASAVLAGGIVAGLAAPEAAVGHVSSEPQTAAAWVDPPVKPASCPAAAAWPYRPVACTADAPARKVRVIAFESQTPERPAATVALR